MQLKKITKYKLLEVKLRHFLGLLLLVSLLPINAWSQSKSFTITGTVKDEIGEPLIGATVTIRNKQNGTITNISGQFELKGVTNNDMLLVSYIGMENKAIPIADNKTLNIVLKENSHILDEVVAIGYGNARKSDLTGSLSSVKGESFAEQNVMSAEQALMGRVAGVIVRSDNSPGGGIGIQIRGSNSMLGGTEPLYVVDGFPVEPNTDAKGGTDTSTPQSSLNYINPADIESLEVLKDASATAIYGARGANGVVLITTKSGKSGTTQVTYNAKFGISNISKKIDVMDAEGFMTYVNQQAVNRAYVFNEAYNIGLNQTINGYTGEILWKPSVLPNINPNLSYAAPGTYPWEAPINTDWQDAIYRDAYSSSHTIQVQGGSTNGTKMSLSLGYNKMDGIIVNSGYERFTLNGSVEHPISKAVKIINKLNISRGTGSASNVGGTNVGENRSIVSAALWTRPTYALMTEYDETNPDVLISIGNNIYMTNPYLLATMVTDTRGSFTFQNNMSLEANLTKNLLATATIAVARNSNDRQQYWPSTTSRGRQKKGTANLATNESTRLLSEGRLNYSKKLSNKNSFSAMLAATFEQTDAKEWFQDYSGYSFDDQTYYNVSSATIIGVPQDAYGKNVLISYIGRLNYNIKDRYLLTATMRADGSSRAAVNKKFGYFPSLAFAWRLSEEQFMKKIDWLSNAKVRLSYGATGSQPASNYQSLTLLGTTIVPYENALQGGVYLASAPNPNLTWEQTDQYNAGVDLSFFKSRLNVTLDLYLKRTHDLLQNANLAPSSGYSTVLMNLGEVENKGFEFDVNAMVYKTRRSSLSVGFNGAINRNKLLSLGNRDYVTGQTYDGVEVNRFIVGQPLASFYGYKQLGVFNNWDEVLNSSAQKNATPGEYIIENVAVDYDKNTDGSFMLDANGNKIASAFQKINADDKTVIGDPNPDLTYGFTLNYKYRDFDFSMLITGQLGGDVFWADYKRLASFGGTESNILRSAYNNSWMAPYTLDKGPDAKGNTYTFGTAAGQTNAQFPRAYDNNIEPYGVGYNTTRTTYREMNSAYVLDGTHVKLQNISIGYTLSKLKIVKELRISLTANNLLTVTNYPGYDPTQVSSNSPTRRGIDQGAYPAQRNYSVNLQVKF
jgi:TonB-linked SusC/RagA family outer membrane protein